jgi:hypothetical protein
LVEKLLPGLYLAIQVSLCHEVLLKISLSDLHHPSVFTSLHFVVILHLRFTDVPSLARSFATQKSQTGTSTLHFINSTAVSFPNGGTKSLDLFTQLDATTLSNSSFVKLKRLLISDSKTFAISERSLIFHSTSITHQTR